MECENAKEIKEIGNKEPVGGHESQKEQQLGNCAGGTARANMFGNKLRARLMRSDQEPWMAGVQKAGHRMCQARPAGAQPSVLCVRQ